MPCTPDQSKLLKLNVAKSAIRASLQGKKSFFGKYMISGSELLTIIAFVVKCLGTLSEPDCQKCFGDLAGDLSSNKEIQKSTQEIQKS